MALRNSILRTLSYFDLFEYPLTKEELFAFLWQPPFDSAQGKPKANYEEFLEYLDSPEAPPEKFGYYFLSGCEANVESRRRRLVWSELKLKIARRAVKWFRSIPYIRAIFVCNTVGAGEAKEGSDIDFFIVTAPDRVWLVRFFSNLTLRLLGLRTFGDKIKDRVCLSFFIDSHNLSLSNLRVAEDDIYLAHWLYRLAPLYDPENIYEKLLSANQWTKRFLPNTGRLYPAGHALAVRDSFLSRIWKKSWEIIWRGAYGNLIEKQAMGLQIQKMDFNLKERARLGDKAVILDRKIIKLHVNDRRAPILKKWKGASSAEW